MNQIIHISNTASTYAAISYARKLAAEGKSTMQIVNMTRDAGWRITIDDAAEIWERYQLYKAGFEAAWKAGA